MLRLTSLLLTCVASVLAVANRLPAADPATPPATTPPTPSLPWTDITNDLGGNQWGEGGVTVVAVAPDSGDLIAGVSGHWLWSSSNRGTEWTSLGSIANTKNKPSMVVFDPHAPGVFWASSATGSPALFATTDAGRTFKSLSALDGVASFAVDLADDKHKTIIVGMHQKERDVEVSTAGGSFFSKSYKLPPEIGYTQQVGLIDSKTYLVSASGQDPKTKKQREVGIWRTDDGGKTWTKVYNNGATGPVLVTTAGDLFWPVGEHESILVSHDHGKSWTSVSSVAHFAPMELPKGWLAAMGEDHLVISTDNGESWDAVGDKLPFDADGVVWDLKQHCFVAWHSTAAHQKGALVKLDAPEDLLQLVNPTVPRDVVCWDGDAKNVGSGWAQNGLATLTSQSTVFRQGSNALDWHVAGKGFFTNAGWLWAVYPLKDEAAIDASAHPTLVVSLRLEGTTKPANLNLTLASLSNGQAQNSKEVDVLKLAPKLVDGQWHDVAIPISAFAGADPKKMIGIGLSANNGGNEFAFDLYLDNIGFGK